MSPLCAQIWCSARPEHPVSAALPDLEPAHLSPEPAGPCPHRGSGTSSPGAAEPALLPRLPASRHPLDSADSSHPSALAQIPHFFLSSA